MEITQYCEKHGIRLARVAQLKRRPDTNAMEEHAADMRHWRCTLARGRKRMMVYFSTGSLVPAVRLDDLMDALRIESTTVDGLSFDAYCSETGDNPDSRRTEAIYRACVSQARRFKAFLGPGLGLWDELVYAVEGL